MIQLTSKIMTLSVLLLATAFLNLAHAAQREILSIGWEDPHLTTYKLIESTHLVTYKLIDSTDLKKPCSSLEYPTLLHPTNVITNLKENQYPEKPMIPPQPFPFNNSTYQEYPLIYLFSPPQSTSMECLAEPAASMKPTPTTGLEDKLGVTLKEIRQIILKTLDKESKKNASLVCLYWHAMIWELTDCLAPTSTATDDHFKDFHQTFPYIFLNIFSLDLSKKENIRDNTLLLFPNLKTLNLSHHDTMSFYALTSLKNLTSLNLNVGFGPMKISFLTTLTTLSLSFNEEVTDEELIPLVKLNALCLRGPSKVTDKSVSKLTNLTSLDLRFNSKITTGILNCLPNLKELYLEGNYEFTLRDLSNHSPPIKCADGWLEDLEGTS